MSTVASQVILHPVISQSLKLWATTVGRDKTYRAVQYFARLLAWYLIRNGYSVQGARWNNLKASLASGRKLMRLFKPIESLQAALRAMQSPTTSLEQLTIIGRHLGYFGYLTYDMIVWAHSIRFITLAPERANKVNKISLRLWLAGILFSIANGVLKGGRLTNERNALRYPSSEKTSLGNDAAKRAHLSTLAIQRASVHQQLVIDTLDFWLPASALGLVNINDGIVGMLGLISSLIALRTQWDAVSSK